MGVFGCLLVFERLGLAFVPVGWTVGCESPVPWELLKIDIAYVNARSIDSVE